VYRFSGPGGYISRTSIKQMPWWKNIKKYDVFVNHACYTPHILEEIMGRDYKLISIIRDPVERLNSRYSFINLARTYNCSLSKLIKYKKLNVNLLCMHSPLYSFGIDCNKKDYYNTSLIQSKINEINDKFDLILIQEFMQESLLLLRNMLALTWQDLVQISINKTKEKERLSKKVYKMLQELLWPEYLLYNFFKKKFQNEMVKHENLLMQEKDILRRLQAKATEECEVTLRPSKWLSTYITKLKNNQSDFCIKALGRYNFQDYMFMKIYDMR